MIKNVSEWEIYENQVETDKNKEEIVNKFQTIKLVKILTEQ